MVITSHFSLSLSLSYVNSGHSNTDVYHKPKGPFFLGFSSVSPLKSFTFGAL